MIELKSSKELERMRQAGAIVASLLAHLKGLLKPGMKTRSLDEAAVTFIRASGAEPAFLGYRGYPASICVSVNEEVVHGIPGERRIQEGDLVSLDVGVKLDGYFSDAAATVIVGETSPNARRLVEVTKTALDRAIEVARVGRRLSDISHTVQQVVEGAGFGVVRDFVGHGIGRSMHEDPPIPNFGPVNRGPRLVEGMVLAIEPMVTMGNWDVEVLSDGWTAVTKDRSLAAHFEHTVAITDLGPDVLTEAPSTPSA